MPFLLGMHEIMAGQTDSAQVHLEGVQLQSTCLDCRVLQSDGETGMLTQLQFMSKA